MPDHDRPTTLALPRIAGIGLVVALVVLIEALTRVGVRVPNPPAIVLTLVVACAFMSGLRAGLASAAIACLWFVILLAPPERLHLTDDNLQRGLVFAVTTPLMAAMAGFAKRRGDHMAQVSLEKEREHSASLRALLEERTRVEADLSRAKDAAEAASRAKSEFLANMSHELRTPMTSILGYAEMLRCNDLPGLERISHAETILRNGEQLLRLLNEVLDLSRIEAGKMSVSAAPCEVAAVLADVESLMRVRAFDRKLDFSVMMCEPIPSSIFTDRSRLRQILINLIGNAIKFTDSGSVSVRARYVPSGTRDGQLVIDVVDTGVGMSEAQRTCLFNPFSQVDRSSSRRFHGTGLGLYISRTLARLMGGEITVESEPGAGSTFTLALAVEPLDEEISRAAQPGRAPPSARSVDQDAIRGVRVLLAEDSKDNQRLIMALLKRAGADVVLANDGAVALEKASSALADGAPYDVVLMDMEMPVLDGYGATVRLRDRGYKGPILALTAHAMAANRARCLAVGCDEHLTKPLDVARLIDAVARHSGRRSAQPTPTDTAPLFSTFRDDEILAELLPGFCGGLIGKIAELRRGVAGNDVETLARVAHGLAGAGGSYGFQPITESGRRLEQAARVGEGHLDERAAELIALCERAVVAHATREVAAA